MLRILVADDERIERMVLLKKLRKRFEDCIFFEAENGRQVLELYEKENIQILVSDIEMPGVTGIEAAEKIREQDQEIPIIFLTAFDDFHYAKKAIKLRVLEYLLKPCDEKELALTLEAAIGAVERRIRKEGEKQKSSSDIIPNQGKVEGQDGKAADALKDGDNEDEAILRERMISYIKKHYAEDISVQDISDWMHYSEAYFCKIFKKCIGKSFVSYLSEYRIQLAKEELKKGLLSVKDVGKSVGYPDNNYFAKVFKRVTGMSPKEYVRG